MNSRLKYPDNIKDLAAHCRKIYNQILVTDWVQLNTKLANTKVANTPTRFIPLSFQTILLSTSGYRPKPGNTFSPLTNKERLKLMKEKSCFYYQQPEHTIANCPKNITKEALVTEIVGTTINNSKILRKK